MMETFLRTVIYAWRLLGSLARTGNATRKVLMATPRIVRKGMMEALVTRIRMETP